MAPSRNAGRKPAPAPTRRRAAKAAPVEQPNRRPAVKSAPVKDISRWATQAPTDYHRKFAQWIVREVGYNPDDAKSLRAAFLAGVSIGSVARNAFMGSDFLADWRKSEGLAKPGRRPASETPAPTTKRRKPPVEEFDDDDEDESGDDEFADDVEEDTDEDGDDEFADDVDADDDDANEYDEYDDDGDDDEAEEAPAPAPKRRGRPASKPAPTRRAATAARKSGVPPRGKARTAPVKADDDDYVF
jgi:hypothetical protein